MNQRITDLLAGCGDGNPTISLSQADAESIGLQAGQYEANEIRKAAGIKPPKAEK